MDRLKCVFVDKDGSLTKESQSIISNTLLGGLIGFIIGGVIRTVDVPENFKRENQATLFRNRFDANKQLHQTYSIEFIKGGKTMAFKIGTFCFLFQSATMVLYAFRGKYDLSIFTGAGLITGALYKMNMGLKGMTAGGFVGTVLGTIYGAVTLTILYIMGVHLDDVYDMHLKLVKKRHEKIEDRAKSYVDEEMKMAKDIYINNKMLHHALDKPKVDK
ncbi:PREDICTED: RPII140-upstream gene protein [Dufourea novaeangliae]|uniref:RPII140-upstream gene protein n=1 Tax=Dufourea novaeangliae TaxID=178035 RepID=UPI0007673635|nr:PREDICTED: RPII140-upstream gene protein [Dufourea novaeangliae]